MQSRFCNNYVFLLIYLIDCWNFLFFFFFRICNLKFLKMSHLFYLMYLIYGSFYNIICWYYYLTTQRYSKRHLSELFIINPMMFHKIIHGFRCCLSTFSRIYAQKFRSDFLWFSFFLSCAFNFFTQTNDSTLLNGTKSVLFFV